MTEPEQRNSPIRQSLLATNRAWIEENYRPPNRHQTQGEFGEVITIDIERELHRYVIRLTAQNSPMVRQGIYRLANQVQTDYRDFHRDMTRVVDWEIRRLVDQYKHNARLWTFDNYIPGIIVQIDEYWLYEVQQPEGSEERIFRVESGTYHDDPEMFMEFTLDREQVKRDYRIHLAHFKTHLTREFQKIVTLIRVGRLELEPVPLRPRTQRGYYVHHEMVGGNLNHAPAANYYRELIGRGEGW